MNEPQATLRADIVAAWATGTGIGAMAFMVTWLVANRLTGLFLPVPQAPITAMAVAIGLGTAVTIWQGHRLHRSIRVD